MTDALIGHTGFVGSTLLNTRQFEACFNSKNIGDIDGKNFKTVVCAGVSAVKWMAIKDPEADMAAIKRLMSHLDTITADHFVLISTVDVYGSPLAVTELDRPPTAGLHAYGLHRLQLEDWVQSRFEHTTVIRLPGLFGHGLRKNLIYDMLNRNQTDKINPAGSLQWYPMRRFGSDLELIIKASPQLINIAVEPVSTEDIRALHFPDITIGLPVEPAPRYDMHTGLSNILGSTGNYHINTPTVMAELASYVQDERTARR